MVLNFGGDLFPPRQELNTIYDYTDIAAGTGIEEFYPGVASNAVVLAPNKFYSSRTMIANNFATGSSGAWMNDTNFDVLLNLPRTMKGKATISIPLGIQAEGNAILHSTFVKATLRKWDGTNSTDLVSGSTDLLQWTSTAANAYVYAMASVILEVPQTHFKRGETIRLNFTQWGQNAANGAYFFFGCDPANRATSNFNKEAHPIDATFTPLTWGTDPSITTAQLPFRIDF